MDAKKCLKMLRDMKDVAFASVDDKGNPKIRIIDVMYTDDEKLVFCTARGKEFYEQLNRNSNIAITGLNKNYEMIRLHGIAEKLDNQKQWIDIIFENNPSMNHVYPKDSRYILEAFCVREGEIDYFNISKEPIERIYFSLGKQKKIRKGYIITKACIACRKCAMNCPQQCIQKGTPFSINQNHCLHCGLCYENCPVRAISKS